MVTFSFKSLLPNSTTLSSYSQQYYPLKLCMGNEKKKKCSTSSYIGSLTNCENIFQYNKKTFFMSPRETSDPYLDELLNRRSELVLKCKHQNQFLLKNFNSNDWSFEPYDNLRKYNINDIPNGFILLAFSAWVIRQGQNKDIFKLIWRCLCFGYVESFRCLMSARWIYLEFCL